MKKELGDWDKFFTSHDESSTQPIKSRVEKICEVCKTKGEACKTCPASIDTEIKVYKTKSTVTHY